MSGQGSIRIDRKQETAAPAVVTGADNGLSILAGNVELGGNPLTHITSIEMAGFAFLFENFGKRNFVIDPAGNTYGIGDILGTILNGTSLFIDDFTQQVSINNNSSKILNVDVAAGVYEYGDLDIFGAGNMINIANTPPGAIQFKTGGSTGQLILDFQPTNFLYQYGDLTTSNNGSMFIMDDANAELIYKRSSFDILLLQQILGHYRIGDVGGVGNGVNLFLDDAGNTARISNNGSTFFEANANDFIVNAGSGHLISTTSTLNDSSGGSVGTLLNSPIAGNPTKWIRINDNGVARFIPTWN